MDATFTPTPADVTATVGVALTNRQAAASTIRLTGPLVRRILAAAAAALVLAGTVTVTGPTTGASAAVAPIVVVAAGGTVTVPVQVPCTRPSTARGDCLVGVLAPTTLGLLEVGYATGTTGVGQAVTVRAAISAATLHAGTQTWWVHDYADDAMQPLPVRVVRPSQVAAPFLYTTGTVPAPTAVSPTSTAAASAGGVVVGAVQVTHRDLASGRWTGSQQSPVRVERMVGGRWVLAATWTTDRTGVARGQMQLPWGVHMVRVVRPAGDSVTAATSAAVRVEVVPGVAAASVPA